MHRLRTVLALVLIAGGLAAGDADHVVYPGGTGPGAGKHIVLLAGDEEYRSEEAMPMLGRILAVRHGFKCSVLFSLGVDGAIDPNAKASLGGSEALETADVIVMNLRFRQWPDAVMKRFVDAYLAGKPIIGLRTSTHAFNYGGGDSPYKKYSFASKDWPGGFGKQVLGETWVAHHGAHKKEATRGVIEAAAKDDALLRGITDVFGNSDVYTANPPADAKILLRGQVLVGMNPTDEPVKGKKNEPMQPVAWTRAHTNSAGTVNKVLCTTMGAATDLASEGLRRLIVNGVYWAAGIEVPAKADVATIGDYVPAMYGNNGFSKGVRPADLALSDPPGAIPPKAKPKPVVQPMRAVIGAVPAIDPPNIGAAVTVSAGERIALVGNSQGERFSLYGHFETLLHGRFPDRELVVRNFCWPADEAGQRQRPSNYTKIDDPLAVFAPDTFICFFGFNESFAGDAGVAGFKADLGKAMGELTRFAKAGKPPRFVLVTPTACEGSSDALMPDAAERNARLKVYAAAVVEVAKAANVASVDLFTPTLALFAQQPGLQFTINGCHLDLAGDRAVGALLDLGMFGPGGEAGAAKAGTPAFEKLRTAVVDKAWVHMQDYRMINGWYVYGGRNGLNTGAFPPEYQKIRAMVAVRDRRVWDLAQGKAVPTEPDDSGTGTLPPPKNHDKAAPTYLSPEQSIATMKAAPGLEVRLFASEREFPELSKPVQMTFDAKGRLWVATMLSYPQWQPGQPKPTDKLLVLTDANGDGKADTCTTFYDRLHCPTGFELWNGGVLVIDQPRMLFLKDTDGDDKADVVVHWLDGWATDDSHHTPGKCEWSNGGLLHLLEGISMSTTLETPWGPLRNRDSPGAYVLDPRLQRVRRFITPGYGNPWSYVFDRWGQGICGDASSPQQHWDSPLSGAPSPGRKGMPTIFKGGPRPIGGIEILDSRHLPDEFQGNIIYSNVIGMQGLTRWSIADDGAGFTGAKLADLLTSSDRNFRPVDPQIGPDGALWFLDWSNVLIGHLQNPQRDAHRDRQHGRVFRLVASARPLVKPVIQAGKPVAELLEQLRAPEPRTRYRVRRELRDRPTAEVVAAIAAWTAKLAPSDPERDRLLCEALWVEEAHHAVDAALLKSALRLKTPEARAAATRVLADEWTRLPNALALIGPQVKDAHPRVRLEAVRALSFVTSREAVEQVLEASARPTDQWLDYTIEATMGSLQPIWQAVIDRKEPLSAKNPVASAALVDWVASRGKGGEVAKSYRTLLNGETPKDQREKALQAVLQAKGDATRGKEVFGRVCIACHKIGNDGAEYGPALDGVGSRHDRKSLIESILDPNAKIEPKWAVTAVETRDGEIRNGFVISEDATTLTLRIAAGVDDAIKKADVKKREATAVSIMPEGLAAGVAAQEFVDLVEYLEGLKK